MFKLTQATTKKSFWNIQLLQNLLPKKNFASIGFYSTNKTLNVKNIKQSPKTRVSELEKYANFINHELMNTIKKDLQRYTERGRDISNILTIAVGPEFFCGTGQTPISTEEYEEIEKYILGIVELLPERLIFSPGTFCVYDQQKNRGDNKYPASNFSYLYYKEPDISTEKGYRIVAIKVSKINHDPIDGWNPDLYDLSNPEQKSLNDHIMKLTMSDGTEFTLVFQICRDHLMKTGAKDISYKNNVIYVVQSSGGTPTEQDPVEEHHIFMTDLLKRMDPVSNADLYLNIFVTFKKVNKSLPPNSQEAHPINDKSFLKTLINFGQYLYKKYTESSNVPEANPIQIKSSEARKNNRSFDLLKEREPGIFSLTDLVDFTPKGSESNLSNKEISKMQCLFPLLGSEFNYAFSEEPILLNGMKVLFDNPTPTTPITLQPKQRGTNNGR